MVKKIDYTENISGDQFKKSFKFFSFESDDSDFHNFFQHLNRLFLYTSKISLSLKIYL